MFNNAYFGYNIKELGDGYIKNFGFCKKIDELGRIVIPKEIRKKLNITTGDCLEITTYDENIIIKKYSVLKNIQPISNILAEAIYELIKKNVIICDTEKILSSKGIGKLSNKNISDVLKIYINRRESITEKYKKDLQITDDFVKNTPYALTTIINDGFPIGLIIIFDDQINQIDMNYCLIASKILNKYIM